MAFLRLDKNKLRHNYQFLDALFSKKNISWGVVTKMLCGNKIYLKEIMDLGVTEMLDTRITNMKVIKSMNPGIQTIYIKPPAKRSIANVVKYADISFNTDLFTIKLISEEAHRQNKIHKIVIMIEMGDLREGVMGDQLVDFYEKVFLLPNIEIIGLGTNLNCLNGILPDEDKLIQLCLYKQLVEAKFNRTLQWVSGGTSVTLSLLVHKHIPAGINHFRIGEALFFGNDIYTGKSFEGMETDVFKLFTEIIELYDKPLVPDGEQGENVAGNITGFNAEDIGKSSFRAIVDIGLLDIHLDYLMPVDENIKIIEASSDMLVVDLGSNLNNYRTGDLIAFRLKYMGVLGLMNSNYIDKVIQ